MNKDERPIPLLLERNFLFKKICGLGCPTLKALWLVERGRNRNATKM